ncbi:uncharacterized protein METZ01_LOCUS458820, partial [marine metagenome]
YKLKGGEFHGNIDPYHAEAYKLYMEGLHLISLRLGKIPSQEERIRGRELLRASIQLDPDLKEAYIQLGWDYLNNSDYQESLGIHNQLLSISHGTNDSSGIHSALIMSATINLKLGEYQTAEDEYLKSLQFSTEHKTIVALYKLGIIYREKNQFDNSIFFHKKALKTSIQENEYYYQGVSDHYLGESYFYFGKFSQAIESFNSALDVWRTLNQKHQEIWTQSWKLLAMMQLNQSIESKDLLSEIEFSLVEYQL